MLHAPYQVSDRIMDTPKQTTPCNGNCECTRVRSIRCRPIALAAAQTVRLSQHRRVWRSGGARRFHDRDLVKPRGWIAEDTYKIASGVRADDVGTTTSSTCNRDWIFPRRHRRRNCRGLAFVLSSFLMVLRYRCCRFAPRGLVVDAGLFYSIGV